MMLLKVIEKELGVAINHARILAGQAGWAGEREMSWKAGTEDRV